MKYSATLKGKKDSFGRRPVYIRRANGKERTFRITNLRIAAADFDKGKIKSSHPKAKEYNEYLKRKILDWEFEDINPSNKKIPGVSFFHFCNQFISEVEDVRSSETIRQYHGELKKIKGFKESIMLSQITHDFLKDYSKYCYSSLHNKENTVWKTFKFLKMIIKKAVVEKKISEDPFLIFKMPKYKDPEKRYLTRDEINKIDSYCLSDERPAELSFIGTWAVISFYTSWRFADCRNFDKKKIKSDRIIIYTQKTGQPVSLPFTERLKKLFERINYKPLHYTNEYTNRMLRILSEANDIEPFSFHALRHGFGVMAASAGIRREVIAKLMGHKDIRTTAIYAQLTGDTIDDEYSKMG